jgi:hypothetical protein
MSGKKFYDLVKHLNLVSLCVPTGVIVASAIFSLRPMIQQAFIGIMLLWFGFEAITGFEFWR